MRERERERERASAQAGQRQRERERQKIPSRFHTASTEPDMRLELMNYEFMA